ncbi:MAG: proton-conducting transporter membrane subunit [Myxococcota bacterium]
MRKLFPDYFKPVLETDFQIFLFENDFKTIFPEIFCILASVLLLVYGVVYARIRERAPLPVLRRARIFPPIMVHNVSWLGILAILLTLVLLSNNPITHASILYNTLVCDDLTFFGKNLIICSALLSVCIALDYVRKQAVNAFEYIILILLATCSMLFLISSADMISMYLAIEFQSLCFYVLAAFNRNSEFSTEAGLKYFVLGAFSSGILLFGCSLVYGFTGITHFSELTKIFSCTGGHQPFTGALIGIIFVAVGFLFKITAVPFHAWAPDVYEGAPTPVTAFFAITPKIAIFGLFVRLFESSFYDLNSLLSDAMTLSTPTTLYFMAVNVHKQGLPGEAGEH